MDSRRRANASLQEARYTLGNPHSVELARKEVNQMPFDSCFKEAFKKVGSPVGDSFSQGSAAKKLPETFKTTRDISGGYCRGACIDWLRRVLIRGAMGSADRRFVIKQTNVTKIDRMARVWAETKDAEDAKVSAYNNEVREFTAFLKLNSKVFNYNEQDGTHEPDRTNPLYVKYRTAVEQAEGIKAWEKQGYLGAVWKEQAENYDSRFKRKLKEGEKEAQPKGFSQITVLDGCASTADKHVEQYLCTVVSVPKFVVGVGLLLDVSFEDLKGNDWVKAPAGHAIAIFHETEDCFILFDPNLGVYNFNTRMKLLHGLILLFLDGYEDKKSRVSRQTFSGGWQAFGCEGVTYGEGNLDRGVYLRETTVIAESLRELSKSRDEAADNLRKALWDAENAKRDCDKSKDALDKAKRDLEEPERNLKKAQSDRDAVIEAYNRDKGKRKEYDAAFDKCKEAEEAYTPAFERCKAALDRYKAADAERARLHNLADELRVKANMTLEEAAEAAAIRAQAPARANISPPGSPVLRHAPQPSRAPAVQQPPPGRTPTRQQPAAPAQNPPSGAPGQNPWGVKLRPTGDKK